MSGLKKIAFFAPIKPPDHHIPSGDRLIAGNLLKALRQAGFDAELASRYICYSKRSDLEILEARKAGALQEAERLIEHYLSLKFDDRPSLWVTYHPYCKAPDWIGPRVSKALEIPYVTIEAAKTGQGENDEWLPWRRQAQEGILQADRHLCFKPTDRTYLTQLLGSDDKIYDFPSFIDFDTAEKVSAKKSPLAWAGETPVLVTTGMMRPGKKTRNFQILSKVLTAAISTDWNIILIGGGPEEENIRTMFSQINPERLHWTGLIEQSEVLEWMKAADIFIWPGWKEPIGMVYLEAQLQELPVIASKSMGVPLVVSHGETGLLSPQDDMIAMQENLNLLLTNSAMRKTMGKAAREKVINHHSLEAAVKRFQEVLVDF